MGRKKIVIKRLTEDRNRNVTFLKRKHGLLKKAWELSVLCGAEVSILIFSHNGKCYEFSSSDLDSSIDRYHAYAGPIERRRAPEFAAMAENGGKDDGSDLEDDEPVGPGGDNSTAPKGMSLKGKEEWKDVSLPRISGSGQSLGSVGEVGKQTDGPTRSVGGKHTGNGNGNGSSSRARARTPIEVKGKTREMNVYPASSSGLGSGSSSGSGINLASQPQQGSTSLASSALGIGSRTVTGSWTGQGGYQDDRVYERSEPGFQDDRNGGYHERASLAPFYPPHKQPSMYSLYQQRIGSRPDPHDRNDPNPSSSSYRSDGSRYPSFDGPAPSFPTTEHNSSHMGGAMTTPSPVHYDAQQQQAYAQYSLPVDHGINPDGSIDWNKATAAAQLQAALHAQQAQLAYLRQQRQQQEHWRDLLAATAGGHGSLPPGFGAGAGGGAMMGNAVQRFNDLVAAGHDPMNTSNGFQWPTHNGHAGGTSGLGLSTSAEDDGPNHLVSMSTNPDWFSETTMRSSGIPLSTHSNHPGETRSPGRSRPASPISRQPSLSVGQGGYSELGENTSAGKRARQEEDGPGSKRARLDSMSNAGMPSSDASG